MFEYLIMVIISLAALSFLQRFLPWAFYSKFRSGESLQKIFDMLAVSAFTALFVYNVQKVDLATLISLAVAFVVVLKTKNMGLTVIAAMIVSIIYILL
ncbi:MAG: AzlD domain-containing protein [Thermoplasmataceae archaeon]|jgi:branched-subunit amino acid transport protein|nr:AzlD domain-containing protein [Candidatus Thermoplasmatota archaeon]